MLQDIGSKEVGLWQQISKQEKKDWQTQVGSTDS